MSTQKFEGKQPIEQGYLNIVSQSHLQTLPLQSFVTVGRDQSNDLYLEDLAVSSRHFRIEKNSQGYLLRDLQSSNGTFINGARIREAWLQPHDKITAGNTEINFTVEPMEPFNNSLQSKNAAWNEQLGRISQIAQTELSVLISGPSGCGKELLSRSIHENSRRSSGPFVSINCSALSESLVESELFGHCKGSFTGANYDRKGAFQSARGGTLFLDEIGDLPVSLQPKLLRALENNEIRPVGSDINVNTDVRIVAATHQNLQAAVRQGHFRQDLYFRLNVVRLTPPPLKSRLEDFETLMYYFAKEYRVAFTHSAMEKMKEYEWPGNIRELKNVVARASALFGKARVKEKDLSALLESVPIESDSKLTQTSSKNMDLNWLKSVEREMIIDRLLANGGNQRKTAQDLGMPKSTLHDRIRAYSINIKNLDEAFQ